MQKDKGQEAQDEVEDALSDNGSVAVGQEVKRAPRPKLDFVVFPSAASLVHAQAEVVHPEPDMLRQEKKINAALNSPMSADQLEAECEKSEVEVARLEGELESQADVLDLASTDYDEKVGINCPDASSTYMSVYDAFDAAHERHAHTFEAHKVSGNLLVQADEAEIKLRKEVMSKECEIIGLRDKAVTEEAKKLQLLKLTVASQKQVSTLLKARLAKEGELGKQGGSCAICVPPRATRVPPRAIRVPLCATCVPTA